MKNFRLLPLLLIATALLPTALFLWTASSILKKKIHSAVSNDPQVSLAQGLSGLRGAYNQWTNKIYQDAFHFSQVDDLKKLLTPPIQSFDKFKVLGTQLSDSSKCPVAILAGSKGEAYYSTLDLPQPAAPAKKTKRPKNPSFPILNNFPGLSQALAGQPASGFFYFQDTLYEGSLVPVSNHGKNVGAVILGIPVNDRYIQSLHNDMVNDLAVYTQAQTWCSRPGPAPRLDYAAKMEKMTADGRPSPPLQLEWNQSSYLADGFPLYGLDMKPLALLALFQPIKQMITVEGSPQKLILKAGLECLVGALLLAALAFWLYSAPFNQLVRAVEEMKAGNLNSPLPVGRPDELGHMARTLQAMAEGTKEKDRISLVLGKVVSPQIAKNILESRDLFALKGEKRECTILYADLRGFNTLSENMAPQALVEALNEYFSLINEIVFKHEGMLDKFIGDKAIALWGVPVVQEDKEFRATQAALEIQESLKDFNISRIKKGSPPFTIGVGIHTGQVVSGNLGSEKRSDYTIIGDPLHIAERLCAMAVPGQTVVSEETYEKLRPLVKATLLNPIAVKGSMEPLKTYEITKIL